jgi:hypothetical protein
MPYIDDPEGEPFNPKADRRHYLHQQVREQLDAKLPRRYGRMGNLDAYGQRLDLIGWTTEDD